MNEAENATSTGEIVVSGMTFKPTGGEAWREYVFKDGTTLRIDGPMYLNIKQTKDDQGRIIGSSHRVMDASGVSHWIGCNNVVSIRWKAKDGYPAFSF